MILCIRYSRLYHRKHETVTDNPSITIYVNKIVNRITFQEKTGYYLQLLTTGTMKLLRVIKNKITKNENGENLRNLEISTLLK